MNKLLFNKKLLEIKDYILTINLNKLVIFSVLFAILGIFSVFLKNTFSIYLCGDKLYSTGFTSCNSFYETAGFVLSIVFFVFSFVLSLILFVVYNLHFKIYLKIIGWVSALGILLTILFWDNSSGGFFNINFGPIIFGIFLMIIIAFIVASSWSLIFKRKILFTIIIIICILVFSSKFKSMMDSFNERLRGSSQGGFRNGCNELILYRAKDQCLSFKAIKEDNIDLCNYISSESPDFIDDCHNYIYRNRGSHKNGINWCSFITDSYQKKLCYELH
jgi:hypothetical protein